MTDDEINVAVMAKGRERYVLLYSDERFDDALRQCRRWAFDPMLSFSLRDSAKMRASLREQQQSSK
jgi:hypothetical protein